MKFKNSKKSPEEKAPSSPSAKKGEALKDEIREIVEETVDEVLKEKEEKGVMRSSDEPKEELVTPETAVAEEKESEAPSEEKEELPAEIVTPSAVEPTSAEVSPVTPPVTAVATPEVSTPSQVPQEVVSPQSPEVASPIVATTTEAPSSEEVVDNDVTETEEIKRKSPLLKILLAVLFLLIIGFGYYYLSTNHMLNINSVTSVMNKKPSPSKAPVSDVTPTAKAVDLSAYKISVLNGSGVAGEASKVKTSLTQAGFSVTSTGNADTTDVTDTIISAKANVSKEYLTKLTDELGKTYKVASETKKLEDSDETDVVVTIGSTTK